MPCDLCTDPDRCDRFGLCQKLKFPYQQEVKECRPGGHCERNSRGLGACVAGFCNPPKDDAGVIASDEPSKKSVTGE